jgi:hypothetical protein
MRTQCKTCGKNCEGEYCFQHKPRKRISVQSLTNSVKKEDPIRKNIEMKDFFLQIWKDRPHKSEVSGDYLASEPLHVFFHHILPKNKYPEACLDEENIILLTWEEHDQVESDVTRYEEVNKRREQLKKKYEIT